MSITITSAQWTAIAEDYKTQANTYDPSSETYNLLKVAQGAAESAAANPSNTALASAAAQSSINAVRALKDDSNASAALESINSILSNSPLTIPDPENTNANLDNVISKFSDVSSYANSAANFPATAEADLVGVMQLFLEFTLLVRKSIRAERKAELDAALEALNNAAEKIHNAALDRYKGAVGKAVFEIAGAATTIGSSVFLVTKSLQTGTEPLPPTRGTETDAEFKIRTNAYESTPEYKAAAKNGQAAIDAYEAQHPRPKQLSATPDLANETDAEYEARLKSYETTPGYKALNDPAAENAYKAANPPPEAETNVEFAAREYKYYNNAEYLEAEAIDTRNSGRSLWRSNEAVDDYKRRVPPPIKNEHYQAKLDAYEATPEFRAIQKREADLRAYEADNPRPIQAESDAHWKAREVAHNEAFQKYTQEINMKQTMLMTYSQLTGALGQLVSAPGGVFEASFNLKAADEETEQKKLEAEAQMHNAKADDAQSTKQSMSETISTIISTLKDIKRNINDLNASIIKVI